MSTPPRALTSVHDADGVDFEPSAYELPGPPEADDPVDDRTTSAFVHNAVGTDGYTCDAHEDIEVNSKHMNSVTGPLVGDEVTAGIDMEPLTFIPFSSIDELVRRGQS